MFEAGEIIKILSTYGPSGLILSVLIYILVKGEFIFIYPRPKKNSKRNWP
jgi:hypothetical protein